MVIHLRIDDKPFMNTNGGTMKETLHDYLLRRLKEYRGRHSEICRETGVPQSTISRIHGGAMPTLATAQPLLDWFEAADSHAAAAPPRRSAARRADRANRVGVVRRRN